MNKNAKLIVDGGILSNGCGSTWKGIKIIGNSSGYSVEIKNNALIENTSEAAVSMFASGGWLLGQGNAKIKFTDSEFKNCKKMLELGALTTSYNPSIIDNCVHNGGKWSITNWNCYGVSITNNDFNNISHECIATEVGQFLIQGNTFHSGRADILFANVSPGFGTAIRDNQLYGANTGVRALGTTLGQHEIEYNQFLCGEFDAFMDDDNNYLFHHNDVTADFGVVSANNGIHSNDVFRNQVTGNFVGLLPLGNNPSHLFYENCFNTSFADNYIEGIIGGIQANPDNFGPANNCFSHGGNSTLNIYDMTGDPDPFTYIEPGDANIDCRDAVLAHPNITRMPGTSIPNNICQEAGSGQGSIPPQYNPCHPRRNIGDVNVAITWLQDKISQIQNDPNLSPAQKDMYISFYRRCLNRIKGLRYELMIQDGQNATVRAELINPTTDDDVLIVYSTYIAENNLTGASQYLASLTNASPQLSDFITIQQINLNRLNQGRVYMATASEQSVIETIAHKNHPYAGYAKALYYWLTGEIISTELPDFGKNGNAPRYGSSQKAENNISIYPNPFRDIIHIKYQGDEKSALMVTDILGNQVYNSEVTQSLNINTQSWNAGIYIITLQRGKEMIMSDKFVKIR
ncbi:MAG TPA: T9SS type A sorting domain-containing protein [Saprospiraceae bacterium]|nr:T9SS type A sorting domain-containing protein [Lewinellaceae bacterium]HPK09832.1 T9SS type A sorting domain-containing protein [Saprospiraceae bacterium]